MELAQTEEKLSKPEEKTRLESFLEFQTAPNTRKTYKGGLKKFFAVIYPNLPLEEAAEQYFDEGREEEDYEKDVDRFHLSIRKMTPLSVRTHIASTRAFLEENRVILPATYWRRLARKKRGGKRTRDRYPTDEELVRIFEHLPLRAKALFHLLATSGIRKGAALQLRRDDILLNEDHIEITVRAEYEKSGEMFIAFASTETKDLMVEWLRVRKQYIASAVNRSRHVNPSRHGVMDANDERIFPMTAYTANTLWMKALEDVGLAERDPRTNWSILHPHTLRRRVRSKMAEAGVPSDFAERLIGHRTYMDEYKKWDTPVLLKEYKKAESRLVFSGVVTRTVKELGARMEKENKDLQFQVDILTRELTRLTTENEDLKKNVNAILALGEKMTRQERYDSEMKSVKEERQKSKVAAR